MPPETNGLIIEYIKVADADSAVGDYGLSITVNLPGTMLLFIDPTIDVANDMPWVISSGYTKEEGIVFTLDLGGSSVEHDLWALDIDDTASPVITGPQNNDSVSNYGVAFVTDAADLEISISDTPDPYIYESGDDLTRIYTVQNLGYSDIDEIVVGLSASGITDGTFVGLATSPNSSFNSLGQFKWRIPTLTTDETATLTFTNTFGPGQTTGVNVITFNALIESIDGFDPNLDNNSATETLSVLDIGEEISGVTRLGSSENCNPTAGGALLDGSIAYCDEVYEWTNPPPEAEGQILEYIMVSNADAGVEDYGLSFTVAHPGSLLLFIDPIIDVANDMTWVINDGYQKEEGISFTLDQDGPTVIHDLWALYIDVPASPVITGPQNNGTVNNYGVAYVADIGDLALSIEADPNPYRLGSGEHWTLTATVENLGHSDIDAIVIGLSATGINDSPLVSLATSPNSTFNSLDLRKWRVQNLDVGETATLTVVRTFGPEQATGDEVISSTVAIESIDGYDPNPGNDSASVTTTILGDTTFEDGFEDPPPDP